MRASMPAVSSFPPPDNALGALRPGLALAGLIMLLPTASCVPAGASGSVGSAAGPAAVAAPAPSIPAASRAAIVSLTAPVATAEPVVVTPAGGFVPGTAPARNAAIPFSGGPSTPAAAFFLRARGGADARPLQCLTEAIYYEAASESDDGQRAVAQVVLNRMRHPAYPASVCGVVYQNAERWLSCQFSFACDGARTRVPSAIGWARARAIAAQALAGRVFAPVGTATHYHTWNVVPFWAHRLEKSAVVGAHIFYRLNGAWGRGGAFSQRYAGVEPAPVPVRAAPILVVATADALVPPVGTPVLPLDLAQIAPPIPVPGKTATVDVLTVPRIKPSPIMDAVPASPVREEFANSGAVKPEFARGH